MIASRPSPIVYWGVLFLLAAVIYLPSTLRPLRDAESKYAEIPREMVELGDWLTPHLDYARYYVKPPLSFWTTAILYKVLGVKEWVARMSTILWAFAAALALGWLDRRMFDGDYAFLTAGFFLLTTEVFVYCLDVGIEFALITCVVLALTCFWVFYRTDSLAWLCLFYLAMGLGFMAKALPGVVIPGGVAFLFLLSQKEGKRLLRLFHPVAVLVFVAVAAPWIVMMLREHADFFRVFFVNEHWQRFAGAMDSNDALFPTSLFLALVAGEFFPWILLLPQTGWAVRKMVTAGAISKDKVVFLLIWAVFPLLLFSLSRSKVDFYGLHSYPPLILLVSLAFKDLLGRRAFSQPRQWAYPWYLVAALALSAALALFWFKDRPFLQDLGIPSLEVAHIFLVSSCVFGLFIAFSFAGKKVKLALLGVAVFMVVLFYSAWAMYVAVFPQDSMKFAADLFNREAAPWAMLVTDERPEFEHSAVLNFYTGKPVFLLRNNTDSVLHFIQKDRQAMCLDEDDLVRLSREKIVYLVGETEETIARLTRLGLAFWVLGESGDRSFFRLGP